MKSPFFCIALALQDSSYIIRECSVVQIVYTVVKIDQMFVKVFQKQILLVVLYLSCRSQSYVLKMPIGYSAQVDPDSVACPGHSGYSDSQVDPDSVDLHA